MFAWFEPLIVCCATCSKDLRRSSPTAGIRVWLWRKWWYGKTKKRWKDQERMQDRKIQVLVDLNLSVSLWLWWWWWWRCIVLSTPWYLTKCDWDNYKESVVFIVVTMLGFEVRVIRIRFPGGYLLRITVGPTLVKAAGTWSWPFIPSSAQVKNKRSPMYIACPGTALDWWLVACLSDWCLNFFHLCDVYWGNETTRDQRE